LSFDPISVLSLIIPILIAFGVSILTMTMIHLGLSSSGNRFATEITCFIGIAVFCGAELLFGIESLELTLLMLGVTTPMMVIEAFRPSSDDKNSRPQVVEIPENSGTLSNHVLCLRYGKGHVVLAAIRIKGVPLQNESRANKDRENDELKWLYPLWKDSKNSTVTYTLEAKCEYGLADLRLFVVVHDKDVKRAVAKTNQSIQIATTWLDRVEYDYEVITSDDLSCTYHELDYGLLRRTSIPSVVQSEHGYLGRVSIDTLPDNLSSSWSEILQQFLRERISGHALFSLASGPIPKLNKFRNDSQEDTKQQVKLPYRVEDHKLRETYKQIAEVEACEETGAFRTGIVVLIRGESAENVESDLRRVEAVINGVWGGVKASIMPANRLRNELPKVILRDYIGRANPISGARVTGLLQISHILPGVQNRLIPPAFAIPFQTSHTDSIPIGHVVDRGRITAQEYSISIDAFCLHVGAYGNPGSGKTNTALELVRQIHEHGVPFLAIVPAKTEWRLLAAVVPELRIFTAGDDITSPFRYNFFDVPSGVPVQTHINNITLCFIAHWPTEGILTEHISKIFRRAYTNAGWNLLTNKRGSPILLGGLYSAMEEVANELRYGDRLKRDFMGALTARFESLLDEPILSVMFNTRQGLSIPELLHYPTLLELRHLPDAHRALVTSLVMVAVTEYLEAQESSSRQELHHLLVLEEAHHVLKRVNGYGLNEGHSSQQQAIDTIVQLLREARGLGLGVMLIDQLPGSLTDAAVKLPGITIIHSLKDARERLLVGGQANLNDEQLLYTGLMDCGDAVIHQGFSGQAVNVRIVDFQRSGRIKPLSDQQVADMMTPFFLMNPHLRVQNLPIVRRWEPDSATLSNLIFLTESPDFREMYLKVLAKGQEHADAYVKGLVQRVVPDATEVVNYTNCLLDHLAEVRGSG